MNYVIIMIFCNNNYNNDDNNVMTIIETLHFRYVRTHTLKKVIKRGHG